MRILFAEFWRRLSPRVPRPGETRPSLHPGRSLVPVGAFHRGLALARSRTTRLAWWRNQTLGLTLRLLRAAMLCSGRSRITSSGVHFDLPGDAARREKQAMFNLKWSRGRGIIRGKPEP